MVIKDLKKEISEQIGQRDAQLLITGALDISVTEYMLSSTKEIPNEKAEQIRSMASRISKGEPLQYVVGNTEFMSLQFKVQPGVLIPRPDTETLVECAIKEIASNKVRVLDIGSGSGCVAISIAHYCKASDVTSVDISDAALQISKENAKLNNTSVSFINCDILNDIPDGKFDIIVSNPPYIPTEVVKTLDTNVKDYEPETALDGGADGLNFYRRIVSIAPKLLNNCGKLMFEVGHDQAEKVSDLMAKDFTQISLVKDLCGINRVVCGTIKNNR